MRQGFYRVVMVLLAVWAALCVPSVLFPVLRPGPGGGTLAFVALATGYALVPVAAFGLWGLRAWGLAVLLLAALLTLSGAAGGVGAPAALPMAAPHLLGLALTGLRLLSRRAAGTAATEAPHPPHREPA